MNRHIDPEHPLNRLFAELVHDAMGTAVSGAPQADVELYLTNLLVNFIHTDEIFRLRDRSGRRLASVSDMILEGDVLLEADSFEREREVHKHIGDFILFWSGVYPGFLQQLRFRIGNDWIVDYLQQGKTSYHVVSTFDHQPYSDEAATFRKLSQDFEAYSNCLRMLRDHVPHHFGRSGQA